MQLLTLKMRAKIFLLLPGLEICCTPKLRGHAVSRVTPQQVLSIWPVVVPGDPPNPWHLSAVEAASYAREKWIRIQADMLLVHTGNGSKGRLPDPVWPVTLGDPGRDDAGSIRIAFQGND